MPHGVIFVFTFLDICNGATCHYGALLPFHNASYNCPHLHTDVDPDFDSSAENVLDDQESAGPVVKPTGQYPGQRGPGKATITFQNGAGLCPTILVNVPTN